MDTYSNKGEDAGMRGLFGVVMRDGRSKSVVEAAEQARVMKNESWTRQDGVDGTQRRMEATGCGK